MVRIDRTIVVRSDTIRFVRTIYSGDSHNGRRREVEYTRNRDFLSIFNMRLYLCGVAAMRLQRFLNSNRGNLHVCIGRDCNSLIYRSDLVVRYEEANKNKYPYEKYDAEFEAEYAKELQTRVETDHAALFRELFDSVQEAADGCSVEPDGTCPHGYKSPSRLLGIE